MWTRINGETLNVLGIAPFKFKLVPEVEGLENVGLYLVTTASGMRLEPMLNSDADQIAKHLPEMKAA
jgi:hypothetical protein